VILDGGVAVCLLLSAHRAVIFAIAQLSCNLCRDRDNSCACWRVKCSAVRTCRQAAACGLSGWTLSPAKRRWAAGPPRKNGASAASTISGKEPPSTAHTVRPHTHAVYYEKLQKLHCVPETYTTQPSTIIGDMSP